MHHKMLAKTYEIDFPIDMGLVGGIQIHKELVMLYYPFVHYMLSSKIQTKSKKILV